MNTTRTGAPAFSLIEVLIAVLVLGIGLLGLAAVFPVVITQQREASDVILGGVASSAVRNQILASADIAGELISQDGLSDADEPDLDGDRVPNEPPADDQPDDSDGDGVPDDFDSDHIPGEFEPVFGRVEDIDADPPRASPRTGYSYLWEADWEWGDGLVGSGDARTPEEFLEGYRADGGVRFRDPIERERAGLDDADADLPVSARLFPRPYTNPASALDGPQFVWDFVPRRAPGGAIQLAVFVRRIDTGIRVPAGSTLSVLLTADPSAADAVHPVGVDADGRPTRNGSGDYAVPLSARAEPVPSDDYRDSPEYNADPRVPFLLDAVRLDVSDTDDPEPGTAREAEAALLAEVGQRFVDNLGVVREVIEVLDVDGPVVDLRVRPGYSINEVAPPFDLAVEFSGEQVHESARTGKLRQVVFTPHPPVDLFVMEFNAR